MEDNSKNLYKKAVASTQFFQEENYWKSKLSGQLSGTVFPYDRKKTQKVYTPGSVRLLISNDLFTRLMQFSNGSDYRLHMILAAALLALLNKYSGNDDIIIGTPVLEQDFNAEFINTALCLRNQVDRENMTFKELLLQVRQTITGANENQNYPLEQLTHQLGFPYSPDEDFPLFDVVILLENIQDKAYIQHINVNVIFSFHRSENVVEGVLEYNSLLYYHQTIQRIASHFSRLLHQVLFNVDIKIKDIDILTEEEKKQLMVNFNCVSADYPGDKTIRQLFEEQVKQTPDHIAVVGTHQLHRLHERASLEGTGGLAPLSKTVSVTYRELNENSNRLAHLLRERGAKPDTIMALMPERSIEMVIGLLAILKAGGAYLPIDPDYPAERIKYMLSDSASKILLTMRDYSNEIKFEKEIIHISDMINRAPTPHRLSFHPSTLPFSSTLTSTLTLTCQVGPANLAYIIYTSGSTGKPKGVPVKHRGLINLVYQHQAIFGEGPGERVSQVAGPGFDAMAAEVWPCLLMGATLVIAGDDLRIDPVKMKEWLLETQITIAFQPTVIAERLLLENWPRQGAALRVLRTAGEQLTSYPQIPLPFRFYNLYGPTEDTVWTTWAEVNAKPGNETYPPIGRPIANHRVYILGLDSKLQPPGVGGELCIAGCGLAQGYLNRPGLTNETFVENPLLPGEKIYMTGDLTKWLPDGNIEFLGRKDAQVKIRGFRIELGEIESLLSGHDHIKDAVVMANQREEGDKYLCAYIVTNHQAQNAGWEETSFTTVGATAIREYLSQMLPDYMIPAAFVMLDTLPLTSNGKLDRRALPEPEIKADHDFIAPGNEVEKKLAEIWSEVLGVETGVIGIESNFFALGGHSLKVTAMAAKIHKELEVKLPLAEVFNTPTIIGISRKIREMSRDKFVSIEPAEEKEYYQLSPPQKRLFILGESRNVGTAYNSPVMMTAEGRMDTNRFEKTLRELITRHESFRTSFRLRQGEPSQCIHKRKDVDMNMEYHEADDVEKEEMIVKSFVRPFDLSKAPLLRAGLIRLSPEKYVFMFDTHHIIFDGVSANILVREFIDLYNGKVLPELKIQYKDFSEWQNKYSKSATMEQQKKYWLKTLSGEIPVLEMPIDFSRPETQTFEGDHFSFSLPAEMMKKINIIVREKNLTLNILFFSLYCLFLSKYCSHEDLIVGSLEAGRDHPDLEPIIGMFGNFLPIRVKINPHHTFTEFLDSAGKTILEAYENQNYPLEEITALVDLPVDLSRNPLFDTMLVFHSQAEEDIALEIDELKFTPYQAANRTSKLDFKIDVIPGENEELNCNLEYNTNLFKEETIKRLVGHFIGMISDVLERPMSPGTRILDIEIISEEEKRKILCDFNNTTAEYPQNKTIPGLFAEQAAKNPDNIAVVGQEHGAWAMEPDPGAHNRTPLNHIHLTYRQLNKKANLLATLLKQKSVKPGVIVGIGVERSITMILGIFAVLKAGGAYLPVIPRYPAERKKYLFEDSRVGLLLTQKRFMENFAGITEVIDLEDEDLYKSRVETGNPDKVGSKPVDLAYVIYTSGSTGKPKGVMVEHRSVVNRLNWMQRFYPLEEKDVILQKTTFVFDVSVWELFWWSFYGASVCLLDPGNEKSPAAIISAIEKNKVTTMHFVPSMLNAFLDHLEDSVNVDLNKLAGLRQLFSSGEALGAHQVVKFNKLLNNKKNKTKLINLYGPTEATVDVSYFNCPPIEEFENISIPIGKPIDNIHLYVVDKEIKLQPVGVVGELCISGVGLARGYLNKPGLTAEKFIKIEVKVEVEEEEDLTGKTPGKRIHMSDVSHMSYIYKTGDLARWLPNGDIEFSGRIDHQVKIRGFRIELGEIESQLMARDDIKEVVVIPGIDANGDKYLCAYIVLNGAGQTAFEKTPDIPALRKYLANKLPEYMIPSYFMTLEKLPLTPQGKVDRRSLPTPELKTGDEYAAPQNEIEKKLVETWSKALALREEIIGIDNNFFELGGNSLKALTLISNIHKAFNVQLYLKDIFEAKTIKKLARLVSRSEKNIYSAIDAVEKQELYPVSSAQKRLFLLNMMDRENAINYNIPTVLLLNGKLVRTLLEESFKKLIQHHESLRTSFAMPENRPTQIIHDKVEFKIGYSESSEEKIRGKIIEFIKPFDLSCAPLMRAELVKIDEDKHILMVDMHHIIADGTAYMIMANEFMLLYQGKTLPPMRIQYKDFTAWQNNLIAFRTMMEQEEYWLNRFKGEIPVLELPTDFPRPAILCTEGRLFPFEADKELTAKIKKFNLETETTIYMVLLAVYIILLSKYSFQEDIVVGTPITGRNHADLQNVIGTFANMLAMRNYPKKNKSFIDFLGEVKENIQYAFENQDYQFEELVTQLDLQVNPARNPLFDVVLNMVDFDLQDQYREEEKVEVNDGLEIVPYDFEYTSSKYDLLLRVNEAEDTIHMGLEYSVALFEVSTIENIVKHFTEILNQVVENADLELKDIILSDRLLPVKNTGKEDEAEFNF